MSDLDYLYGEADGTDDARLDDVSGPHLHPATRTLVPWAVEAAVAPHAAALDPARSLALVVEVPGPDWVQPVRTALETRGPWDSTYARGAEGKETRTADKEGLVVADALSRGKRVLGVSHAPDRLLPATLTDVADLRIVIPPPSDALVARVVRAATGRRPRNLPRGVGRTLSYRQLLSAIRLGAGAAETSNRLRIAAGSRVTNDPRVAAAVPFEDLRGYGEIQTWGRDLIASVEAWRRGDLAVDQVAGRAALWAGPPGTGKTTAARSLARSLGLPLHVTSVAEWFSTTSGYLDSVVKAVDAVVARVLAEPCVLLLDEIDALPKRDGLDGRSASWWVPVITHVMLQVDALFAQHRTLVVLVAATNHPERVDPALTRAGRFDRILHVRPPDARDLAHIIRQHLRGDLPDEDLTAIAHLGTGATGAAAAAWVARARGKALAERRAMRPQDLADAVAPPVVRSPALARLVAVHEAGHAVAMERLGRGPVELVSVAPAGENTGGVTRRDRPDTPEDAPTRAAIEDEVTALLAGRAAELVLLGTVSSGAGGDPMSDLARATTLVAAAHATYGLSGSLRYRGDLDTVVGHLNIDRTLAAAVDEDLARLHARAVRLVENDRDAVERVVRRLVEERVLTGDTLRRIIAETPARPVSVVAPAMDPAADHPPPPRPFGRSR